MFENDDTKFEKFERSLQKASLLSSLQREPLQEPLIVEKAGFWRRFIAYSIDGFILGIIGRFFSSISGGEGAFDWGQ